MTELGDMTATLHVSACENKASCVSSFPFEEYECKICYNYFNSDRRTPKILDCSHTFCEECLNTLYLRENCPWRIGCPLCRHKTPVPEHRIHNLLNNTKVTDAFPLPTDSNSFSKDRLCPNLPLGAPDTSVSTLAPDVRSYESFQTFKQVIFTTGSICIIFAFLSMLVLLIAGLIFVHNFNKPPSPVGPVCLSVASVLAMFSVVITWLMCWTKHRPEHSDMR